MGEVCEAALHGAAAALAEARKRTGGEEQFKPIAKAAGDLLVNLRKYPLAADLEEAGASGANASETAAYAALYRKTQPHEQLLYPDDPVGITLRFELLRFELLVDDPDLNLAQLRSLTSRNGKTVLASQEAMERIVKGKKEAVTGEARWGLFANVGLDVIFARAQPKVEGNDAIGYKVSLSGPTYKHAVYVVKEDGHYKVLATTWSPAAIGMEALDRIAANDLAGARVLLDWLREDQHLAGGDDPLAGMPFPRFWTKGKDADAATMKLAAASILAADHQTAAQSLAILEAARDSTASVAEKQNILLALFNAYTLVDEYDKAVRADEDLARQYPESELLFINQSYNLRALGRFEEADNLASERLKRIPGDIVAMGALAHNAMSRKDYMKAHDLSKKIIDEGKAEPSDLNSTAWDSLFTGKVGPADIEDALRAAELSKNKAADLHTLGCVYAEVGKTKEAREVLIQAMDVLNLDEPDDDYWYAFCRIAEQYGERDVAIADYVRVKKPKKAVEIPDSSYQLAQIRLQALRGEKQ